MAKKNTAAIAEELAAPILEEMGLQLWDVVYEKEGSGWYLRYYVDKEGGIDINSCEAFSRAISDVLDEKTEMNVERGETAFIRLYNDFSGGVSK